MIAPATVYVLRDDEGDVLYVGLSGGTVRRLDDHRRARAFWSAVTSATFEHFDNRLEAALREADLIRRFDPPYNVSQPAKTHALPRECAAFVELIGDAELTQQEAAIAAGVSVKSLYRWMSGEVPSRRMVLRLAEAFGRDPDFFYPEEKAA